MRFLRKPPVLIGLVVLLIAGGALLLFLNREWHIYKERYFVREVLLYAEYGDRIGKVARWTNSPRIVFASDDDTHQSLFNEVVSELNDVLKGTGYQLITDFSKDLEPHVFVFVTKPERFREIAGIMACDTWDDELGYACLAMGADWSYKRAVVLVSAEPESNEIRSILSEEIYQSLGPANDSAVYPDSLVYETEDYSPPHKTLSARDRKLLRFLYMHLKPGDGEKEVRRAFAQHWDKMEVR